MKRRSTSKKLLTIKKISGLLLEISHEICSTAFLIRETKLSSINYLHNILQLPKYFNA